MFKQKHKVVTDKIQKMKDVKRSSARVYASNISRIHREYLSKTDFNHDMKWLVKNSDKLIKKLKDIENLNTQRNLLAASLVALQLGNSDGKKREPFVAQIAVLNHKQNEQARSGVMSESAQKKFLSWKKILQLRALLSRTVRLGKFYTRTKISRSEFAAVQQNLILHLYTELPPVRNTWSSVVFKSEAEFSDMTTPEQTTKNILVMKRGRFRVYWADFKTVKRHGIIQQVIPKKLQTLLKKHIKFLRRIYPENENLLLTQTGKPLSSNALTHIMQRLFYKHFRRKIGTSALRTIFLTHTFDKEELEKQRDIAHAMHHTTAVQRDFYVKEKPNG